MKTINKLYLNKEDLHKFICDNELKDQNILLQIFTGICDFDYICTLIDDITSILPNIKILGTTTSGEIIEDITTNRATVLSFSLFENTIVETYGTVIAKNSKYTAQKLINQFENLRHPKVIISFADGLHINGEEYINRFVEYDQNIVVAGGLAGDNEQFKNTIVFTESEVYLDGAVVALLINDDLEVVTKASFGWVSIGETMTITSSMKNVVYEIDGKKGVDIYAKYLGSDIAKELPKTGIEFPLLVKRSDHFIPRAVVGKNSDGSLIFAGNLNEGEKVTFGYGNIETIVKYSDEISKSQDLYKCESIFIYSCMARKALLRKSINLELSPLNKIAPISGFFTYGEFYANRSLEKIGLLNQTMTILGLSESKNINKEKTEINFKNKSTNENRTLKALTHLISVTSKELDSYKNRLEERVREATVEIQELNKELEDTQKEIVYTFGMISEGRSKETGAHIKRVAEYSKLLALYYGLSSDEVELIKQASPMHDIGKIAIPDSILNKPGKLTKEEFEIMKKHAEYGYEMINKSNRPLLKAAAIIAYEHHEKFDGTGYPRGLKGYEIHIYGRVVALADVYDALSTKRCYKDAWSDDKIKELIKSERGRHFDPKLADIMLEHYDEFVSIKERILDSSN